MGGNDVKIVNPPQKLFSGILLRFRAAIAVRVIMCRILNVLQLIVLLVYCTRIFSGARGSNFQVVNILLWISWYGVSSVVSRS